MELTLGENGQNVDINYAPQHTQFLHEISWDVNKEVSQPIFESQRLTTQLSTRIGQPTLVGTMSPPVGSGVQEAHSEPRVWLHFITIDYPQ